LHLEKDLAPRVRACATILDDTGFYVVVVIRPICAMKGHPAVDRTQAGRRGATPTPGEEVEATVDSPGLEQAAISAHDDERSRDAPDSDEGRLGHGPFLQLAGVTGAGKV
jgi:hypothetical protein